VVLGDASLPNVRKKCHVAEVYIFVHVSIEFRLLDRSTAVVIKS
jgi:hypothetical protein